MMVTLVYTYEILITITNILKNIVVNSKILTKIYISLLKLKILKLINISVF